MIDFSTFNKLSVGGIELRSLSINGIEVWRQSYQNRVPTSIDADGSRYKNIGYIEGYRVSSSGALSAQTGTVTTGFIAATNGDIIRMAGVRWGTSVSNGYCYIQFYDASFQNIGHINKYGEDSSNDNVSNISGIVDKNKANSHILTDNKGVTTFDISFTADSKQFSYFRISATGKGADMIVTVNEEIT